MALFDGLAGLLNDAFGGPVTYTPKGGASVPLHSVFRRQPTEGVDDAGQPVLIMAPTWRVRSDLCPTVRRGDQILAPDGRVYEIQNVQKTGSPAGDAFFVCELFEAF